MAAINDKPLTDEVAQGSANSKAGAPDRRGTQAARARRVCCEGPCNFRDLGGYPIVGGGRVRWGHVFRSDALGQLTDRDRDVFAQLGVREVYDLRSAHERDEFPNPVASQHLSLGGGLPPDLRPDLATLITRADGERWLAAEYRWRVTHSAPGFGRVLTRLAAPGNLPAVFHCAGGKDRTGLVAALLLSWLGVDRATVPDDYELTAQWRTVETEQPLFSKLQGAGMSGDAATGFLGAPRWVMIDALEMIDRDHGGVEAYLRGPAAMTSEPLDALRRLLIE